MFKKMFKKLICNHFYEKVQKDGYQYCKNCGQANFPPRKKCTHRWKIINKHRVYRDAITYSVTYSDEPVEQNEDLLSRGYIYTLQCQKCGNIFKEDHSWKRNYEEGVGSIF